MVRQVITYPDARLKMVSKEVEQFDSALCELLDDMYETMIAHNGVGLAAIQVTVPLRVLIINNPVKDDKGNLIQPKENTLEVINPVIVESEGKIKFKEGCLSVPGFYEAVDRYKRVKVEYFDRDGNKQVIEDDGFLAIALQHEMDHLDGKLFIENSLIPSAKSLKKSTKSFKSNEGFAL